MNRQTILILAVLGGGLMIALAVWLGLSSTAGYRDRAKGAEAEVAQRQVERQSELCGSNATYGRLKELAFEEAVRLRAADPTNLDTLGASAVVRMENPVVRSRDANSGETLCAGRLVLELPPGAERAFGGERRLIADVTYGVQPAADGSGMVYRLDGAEALVARLAAFELASAPPPLAAPPAQSAPAEPEPRQAPAASPGFAPPREVVQPIPRAAPPPPAPAPAARARPSFNCRYARSRSERLICGSPSLAAADRAMSSLFYQALAEADGPTRRALRATRDRFLVIRDRCASEACVARVYRGRIDEIADIAAGDY